MRIERLCPWCNRVITDRTLTKCPNFRRHVAACPKRPDRTKSPGVLTMFPVGAFVCSEIGNSLPPRRTTYTVVVEILDRDPVSGLYLVRYKNGTTRWRTLPEGRWEECVDLSKPPGQLSPPTE